MGFVEKVNIVAEFIDGVNDELHTLVDEATAQAESASDSATTATEQATIATTQAGIATTQAGIATTKATSATASATSATASAQSASDSATLATTKADSATASATSATASAGTATTQAGIATTKATEASASATSASTSEANALTYKTSAYSYSVNSANSATNSASSATLAQGYANAASNSANSASSSATSAGTSATNANSSAGIATTQASIATTKAGEASTSATNAATSEANALSYKNSASTSATTATTQAGIATTQAGIATTKAGEASASATSASGYASSASTSATNAHNSELAAAQSATTAANTVAPFTSHLSNTSNPHSVTKAQVGLGNVDNTSDATKNSAVATLTNKTIDDITNIIGSNHVHYKVKATQAISAGNLVKVTGYNQGEDAVEIALVSSSSDAAMGMAESAIANGSFGLITVTGVISNINTSSFTVGSILYSNGSGGLTATKPTSGTYQACAVVLRSNLNNGSLLVAFAEPRNVNWDSSYYTKAQTDSNISTAIANLVNSAPSALNTLNELAAALGNDANFATTVTNSLASKAPLASPTFTGTVSGITKSMVGLGSVDNTTDLNKPISTATQSALDLKAPLASPTFTGTATTANLSYTGTLTGGTGVVNIGSGQIYKDASGNVGIGTTPSAWRLDRKSIDIVNASFWGYSTTANVTANAYINSSNQYIYKTNDYSSWYNQGNGAHNWFTASSGTAGNAISWYQAMTLANTGNLLLGTTTDNGVNKLQVSGSASISGILTAPNTSIIGGTSYNENIRCHPSSNDYSSLVLGAVSGDWGTGVGQWGLVRYPAESNNKFAIRHNATDALTIDTSGNVGIGTSSPSVRQEIVGTGFPLLRLNRADVLNTATGAGAIELTGGQLNNANAGNVYARIYALTGLTANTTNGNLILATNDGANNITERMRIDSAGNVGIGTTPSAWGNINKAIDIKNMAFIGRADGNFGAGIYQNTYRNSADAWIYKTSSTAVGYEQGAGTHNWLTAPSGTAGNTITWTTAMALANTGNLLLGTTTDDGTNKLQVSGSASVSGNVGIGTSSPSLPLTINTDNTKNAIIKSITAKTDGYAGIHLQNSAGRTAEFDYISPSHSLGEMIFSGTNGAYPYTFWTNGNERMRIDSSGNVGIGTSSPNVKLEVKISDSNSNSGQIKATNDAGSAVRLQTFGSTASTYGAWSAGDSGLYSTGGNTVIMADYANSVIKFATNGSTERMRIDSSGNLLVGISSLSSGVSGIQVYDAIATTRPNGSSFPTTVASTFKVGNMSNGRSINATGTINALGADYAEYENNNGLVIAKGSIVGFKTDGTLTDKFSESIRFAIKSTNPSYVGGDTWGTEEIVGKRPEQPTREQDKTEQKLVSEAVAEVLDDEGTVITPAQEAIYETIIIEAGDTDAEWEAIEAKYKADLADFEARLEAERIKVDRVAYAGKCPVNVLNANAGDYIVVALGENDTIVGESISNPSFEQYLKAVGKVNKILEDGRAEVAVIIH